MNTRKCMMVSPLLVSLFLLSVLRSAVWQPPPLHPPHYYQSLACVFNRYLSWFSWFMRNDCTGTHQLCGDSRKWLAWPAGSMQWLTGLTRAAWGALINQNRPAVILARWSLILDQEITRTIGPQSSRQSRWMSSGWAWSCDSQLLHLYYSGACVAQR